VTTREMVGPRSPLPKSTDVRLFTDTTLQPGAAVDWPLGDGEGSLLSVREGEINRKSRPPGRAGRHDTGRYGREPAAAYPPS